MLLWQRQSAKDRNKMMHRAYRHLLNITLAPYMLQRALQHLRYQFYMQG